MSGYQFIPVVEIIVPSSTIDVPNDESLDKSSKPIVVTTVFLGIILATVSPADVSNTEQIILAKN